MYCIIVGLNILMMAYSIIIYTYATLRASRSIHARLVKKLLGSTFR